MLFLMLKITSNEILCFLEGTKNKISTRKSFATFIKLQFLNINPIKKQKFIVKNNLVKLIISKDTKLTAISKKTN